MNQRNLRNIKLEEFKKSVSSSSLVVKPLGDPTLAMQYNTVLQELLDLYAPQCIRYVTLRPHAPWFDDSIRKAKLTKRCLERKWRSTRLDRQIYRDNCATFQHLLTEAKSVYHNNKLKGLDQKALFKEVDSWFMEKTSRHCHLTSTRLTYLLLLVTSSRIKLMNFDLLSYHLASSGSPVSCPEPVCSVHLSEFILLEPDEIRKLVMNSPTKSCSLDPVPTILLKICIDAPLPVIASIINGSLAAGLGSCYFQDCSSHPLGKEIQSGCKLML